MEITYLKQSFSKKKNQYSSETKELDTDNTVNKKQIVTDHQRLSLFANKNICISRYFLK